MKIRSINDLSFGSFLTAVGGIGLWLTTELPMGSMGRMGSGFMPTVLCWIMLGIGGLLMLRSLRLDDPPPERMSWRPLLLIMASIAVFAFATPLVGLPIGIILLVLVSAGADAQTLWLQALMLATVLAAFCSTVFVKLLGIPLPLFPGIAL